jgi:C_GCAxxG_C_C family probable redox protein
MKLDKQILEEKIREYRVFKSCSESTLMGLCETAGADISAKEMTKLACGFAGGMGGTFDEGTCGAVTGAIMALGLICDDEKEIVAASKKLFNDFKDKYESVTCGYISKDGDDKSPCVEVCLFAGEKVCEYLKE